MLPHKGSIFFKQASLSLSLLAHIAIAFLFSQVINLLFLLSCQDFQIQVDALPVNRLLVFR